MIRIVINQQQHLAQERLSRAVLNPREKLRPRIAHQFLHLLQIMKEFAHAPLPLRAAPGPGPPAPVSNPHGPRANSVPCPIARATTYRSPRAQLSQPASSRLPSWRTLVSPAACFSVSSPFL